MKTIWKYKAKPRLFNIEMPKGAKVVAVGWQGDDFVFWATVDSEAQPEGRIFFVAGTGHNIPDGLEHRGTVQDPNGLVWHLLEGVK